MKCPKCDGNGYVGGYHPDTLGATEFVCGICNGTGKITQTNEEWIHTLDTEGLVDYLYEVHKGGNTVERQAWIEKHKERVKMQIRGWLKEVHKDG